MLASFHCAGVVASESSALLPDEPFLLQTPLQIEQVRNWHRGWGTKWPWGMQEHVLRLRDDNSEQYLLAVRGYARGGEYVLFFQHHGKWIASEQSIELAHHPVQILPAQRDGWHEFETYVPAWGSGGVDVWVFRYRWSGHGYEQAEQRGAAWCELHYFRETAPDMCMTP
ncbi:MAG: hypothetical protein ACOY3E_02810 [Pseudomonadota bacterium]